MIKIAAQYEHFHPTAAKKAIAAALLHHVNYILHV